MTHQVLARKWRPKAFSEVIGQPHIVTALTNALLQNRLHQAYLFTGTRGVGKTTLARILAKCLNCEQGPTPTPCGVCHHCQAINEGRFIDLIEVDAASRTKVEDTKELLESAQYPPVQGRAKVYLIDEVHMLSTHSFNALLKTLEEPPNHLTFLLATTDPQKLPITILSRCLQFTLKPVPEPLLMDHLSHILDQENIQYEPDALKTLAMAGNGSVRDCLSVTDQAIALTNGHITTEAINTMLGNVSQNQINGLIDALSAKSAEQTFKAIEQLAQHNVDYLETSKTLISTLHKIALHQWLPPMDVQVGTQNTPFNQWAQQFSKEDIQIYYQLALLGHRDLILCPNLKEGFEMLMLRLLMMDGYHANALHSASSQTDETDKAPPESPISLTPPSSLTATSSLNPTSSDWKTLIDALNLTGNTLNLAVNCSLISFDNDHLLLNLSPDREVLKTKTAEQHLQDALAHHFNKTIHIKIQIGQSDTFSPQQAIENQTQKDLQLAKSSIENDIMIQDLKNKMGAMIKPDTVVLV